MAYLFALISFASVLLLLIGLIRPSAALFWQKSGATRKKSTSIYILVTIVALVLTGVTAPPEMRKAAEEKDMAPANGRAGNADVSAEKPAAVIPRRPPLPMSPERAERRALGKRVDTTYHYLEDSLPFDHDTGYLVPMTFGDSPDEPVEGKEIIDVLIQTGPRQYDVDKEHKLRAYMPVWVLGGQMEWRKGHSHGVLWVAPLGSADSFLISTDDFSLKNPTAGTLVQRASNHAYVKAVYTAPADANKRPVDFAGRWIDVPKGASIVVTRYDNSSGKIEAKIFDGDDKVGEAYFDVSTLTPAP